MSTAVKLPVWGTVSVSWRLSVVHWRRLVRIFWLPAVLLPAIDYLWWAGYTPVYEMYPPHSADLESGTLELAGIQYVSPPFAVLTVLELLHAAVIVPGMVAWHRFLMSGRDSAEPQAAFLQQPGRAEIRYLAYGVAIIAIVLVVYEALQLFGAILPDPRSQDWAPLLRALFAYASVPVAIYPGLRLALVLPDGASGGPTSPDRSVVATSGNGWRLVAAFSGTALLPGIVYVLSRANLWLPTAAGPHYRPVIDPATAFVQLAFAVLAASCLSVAAHTLRAGKNTAGSTASGTAPTVGVPIYETIYASYAFLFRNLPTTLRFAFVPAIYCLGASAMLAHLPFGSVPSILFPAIWLAKTAIYLPAVAVAAVPLHRLILTGEEPRPVPPLPRFGRKEWRYVLRLSVLCALMAAAFAVAVFGSQLHPLVGFYVGWPAILAALVLSALMSLSLPAISIGRDVGLRDSCAISRASRISFTAVLSGVQLPGVLVALFVTNIENAVMTDSIVWDIAAVAGTIVQIMICATALSFCYLRMGGMDNGNGVTQSHAR